HSGQLKLRVALPSPPAAYVDDVDALHAQLLALDETGQRLFVITKSGLAVVQLAALPLAIGTVSASNIAASGGTVGTVRGSGFVSGVTATIGGKSAAVTFVDASTITIAAPAVSAGPQRLTLTNPNGETTSLDAAFTAN
ncbi:MAG TPA: IPT/TIG domain-containing protein, partial [Candidatus Acidoferrum sp.]|nr:IPT/TIG domain-containing protein [Candidatus Acidoferrum sp.]